jgi:hypothetical protein
MQQQYAHSVVSSNGAVRPIGHVAHADAPGASANVPTAHAWHMSVETEAEKRPLAH